MGGPGKLEEVAGQATKDGGFENWSWALKLTSLLLELDSDNAIARRIRADAARALGQRTQSANARGFYITEALAMEGNLKLGDQPVVLDQLRLALSDPGIEKLMSSNLEDSFQMLRYLVDPRKAQDSRAVFTVDVEGAESLRRIELRNGVVVISDVDRSGPNHLQITRLEWSEFVTGRRSFADEHPEIAIFERALDFTATRH
jgi:alkyl sulfatase BDS1-like metallo-beta-lactamase superfamily hydrolase